MQFRRYGLIILVIIAAAGALFASKITGDSSPTIEASKVIGNGSTASN
jgi:hypothetical protein